MFKRIINCAPYFVSEEGIVLNTNRGKALKPIIRLGYATVDLFINNEYRQYSIHRLVAEHFIPNPENKPQVNHKDCDKTNNHYTNLEWSTAQENILHAIQNKRWTKIIPIKQYSLDHKLINTFTSIEEAKRSIGTGSGHIGECTRGKRKTAYGFIWER